jgi:hypothetical protein
MLPFAALAGTPVTYTDAGRALFTVEVPDFWSLRTGGLRDLADPDATEDIRDISRVFGMTPEAHDGIWVGLISPFGVSTLAEAREYLRDIGPFLVQGAVVSEPQPRRINGLPARSLRGSGRRNGAPIDFTVLAIDLPNGRVAIAVVVFEAGADTDVTADINAMLGSIRAAR